MYPKYKDIKLCTWKTKSISLHQLHVNLFKCKSRHLHSASLEACVWPVHSQLPLTTTFNLPYNCSLQANCCRGYKGDGTRHRRRHSKQHDDYSRLFNCVWRRPLYDAIKRSSSSAKWLECAAVCPGESSPSFTTVQHIVNDGDMRSCCSCTCTDR